MFYYKIFKIFFFFGGGCDKVLFFVLWVLLTINSKASVTTNVVNFVMWDIGRVLCFVLYLIFVGYL